MSLGYLNRRLIVIFSVMSIFLVQSLFGQGSATLKGTVYDKTSKDQLPGANILVKGTSIGVSTDIFGGYVLRNIPTGEQTLVVSYIGYESQSVVITIPSGGTVSRDFMLTPTEIEGEVVVVTGQAQGQLQAINQQLASNTIANIVSEAKIQELPDFNAAQAISRLPGVSTLESSGEANKVVIRGLAPQYNAIAVSGINLASTGSSDIGVTANPEINSRSINQGRSTDLSMITPYMIKSISVYKALTPDLNANAIGGIVNFELREAPSGLHTDILWQSGYTNKSNTYGNYRFVGSVSDRMFDDVLGVYVLGNIEQYDRNSDNMSGSYSLVNKTPDESGYAPVFVTTISQTRHMETRKRFGGNVVLDVRLPFGTLRSINLFSRLNSDYRDYRTSLNYQNTRIDYTYRAGRKNTDLAINTIEADMDFDFMSVNLKVANNYSRTNDPNSPYFTFTESGGITGSADPNTYPENLTGKINHRGPERLYLSSINLLNNDFKENDQVYKADFKIPFTAGSDISGFFKFGGEYRYNHRVNDQSAPYVRIDNSSTIQQQIRDSLISHFGLVRSTNQTTYPFGGENFSSNDPRLLSSFLDNRFGGILWLPSATVLNQMLTYVANEPLFNWVNSSGVNAGGWFSGNYQNYANDYKYIEKYYGAYLMTEVGLGEDLKVVGGARFEQERSLFEAFNMVEGRSPGAELRVPITTYPQNRFWLPMAQARYQVTEWMDVRYAYTQTLARPDYSQLNPHFAMDFNRNNVWAGNPDLKPGEATNHDLIISLHSNDLGLFTIGGFYKQIAHFTYYTQYSLFANNPTGLATPSTFTLNGQPPREGALLYTYVNSPYNAYVRGIEIDFQTRFWYLPAPFDGVLLGLNYTHISSSATYPWRDPRTFNNPNPPPRTLTVLIDSTRSGRLTNQPDDIFNAYLGYDYGGFAARVSFIFQGSSVSGIGNFREQDSFTKDYFRVDASARQLLPFAGLQLFLDVNNINARKNQSAQQSISAFTSENNYGLTANFGLRFILE